MTVYRPGDNSRAFTPKCAFSLARSASFCGSRARKSAEFALAQLAAGSSCIVTENSARIADYGLTLPGSKNAGSNLALLGGEVAGQANRPCAIFGSERCGIFCETIYARVALFPRHPKKARIFRLAVCQREGGLNGATKGIFLGAIRRGTRGAAVYDGANRDGESLLGDVLMNAVVSEARQTVRDFIDVDLSFLGSRWAGQTNDSIDDSAKFALGEKFRGARFVAGSGLREFGRRLHWFENAVPMRTFLKRAGDAP